MKTTNPTLPRGVLTPEDATAIKLAIWQGTKQAALAQQYGVTQATISHILRGKTWASVPWPDGVPGPIAIDKKIELMRKFTPVTDLDDAPSAEAIAVADVLEKKLSKQEEGDEVILTKVKRRRKRKK